MPQKILYGNVNADGTTYSGSGGFQCRHIGKGTYLIEFADAFASVPTVVLTQQYIAWADFSYPGAGTKNNAMLVAVDEHACKYVTGNSDGSHTDRNCAFIAIGEGQE